jgi:DNA-binding LacI/PurR family transcriptional regulator
MADQRSRKRPTLADVAKLAGVSPITVSRAIFGSAPVHADTKRCIDQAIAELGYVPNVAARRLARGQMNDLAGVMIHDLPYAFWSRVVLAMQADLVQHSINSLVVDTQRSLEEED